ncbi:MAG: lipid biosynthesis acyltransferase [Ignavibacteria bacterium]|nr:lipid biosynthesis acyltransferase [Ignavibacteria bacterium]
MLKDLFERISYNLITCLLLFLGYISSRLGITERIQTGYFIGDLMRFFSRKRELITLENIEKAFPDESQSWHNSLCKNSYRNLGIVLMEILCFKHLSYDDFKKYVHYENLELLYDNYRKGKGLLLMSGHYGNWEYLAYTAGLFSKIPVTIVVNPLKNYIADSFINKSRTMSGNKVVSMFDAARTLINTINEGNAIAMLADQSATEDKDVFIEIFGRTAAAYKAPAALALKFNIPIIMGFAERQVDGTYKVHLSQLSYDDLKFDKDGIFVLTQRYTKALEDAVRRHPDHWLWQHRRWKHAPKYENSKLEEKPPNPL